MSDLSALNLESGAVVGGYTLLSRLGAGAMGSVWRVRDDGGQVYAMKILRDSLADDADTTAPVGDRDGGAQADRDRLTARERLRREAMALKRVNHPGVCGIVDMELDDTLAFIVTDLIEGTNLRDDVKTNGRYTGDDLERLARKLIDAVRAVHAAGIVHRDIKPTNVMVSASGPVLVDFGIAMSGGESHVTRTGLVMGTPGFIAPEIIEGAESDELTDWWSVASVLAYAATGTPVFGTKPMMAVLERAASGNANLTGLPAGTMAAFRAALDPDRRKRCTPDRLLHAIALDALNPFAWQDAATDSGETEVVRPFDGAGPANPRALWRSEPTVIDPQVASEFNALLAQGLIVAPDDDRDDRDNAAATGATSAIPTDVAAPGVPSPRVIRSGDSPATTAIRPDNHDGAPGAGRDTTAYPAVQTASEPSTMAMHATPAESDEPGTTRAWRPDATAVLSNTPTGTSPATQPLPSGATQPISSATQSIDGATQPIGSATRPMATARDMQDTLVDPTLRPAVQRLAGGAPPSQQAAPASPSPHPDARFDPYIPSHPPVGPPEPSRSPLMGLTPGGAMVAAPYGNPADVKRGRYVARGRLPVRLLTIPVAAMAASAPVTALIAAALMLWLLLTLGYSTESQLEREGRRGGERRRSDLFKRAASLPWHLLKALVSAAARLLLMTLALAVVLAVGSVVLSLPLIDVYVPLGFTQLVLPLPSGAPGSASGVTLAAGAAVGWVLGAFAPNAMIVRIGAGALVGLRDDGAGTAASGASDAGDADSPYRRGLDRDVLLAAVLAITTLAALTLLGMGNGIDWWPLF